jgi:prenyltransferase beta subunit
MRSLAPFALCLFVALPAPAQTADEKKATIAYLQKLQTKEGAFRADAKAAEPTIRGTSAALRAIKYFGGTAGGKAECEKFVLSCLDAKTGGFGNRPGEKPDVVVTAVGLMALAELKSPALEKVEPKAIAYMADNAMGFEQVRMAAAGLETVGKKSAKNDAWLARLARMQNADGTFGKDKGLARDTGGAVACVLRLGGKVKDPAAVTKALDAEQRKDGGFGTEKVDTSDLETTYRVMRTYHMLKGKPAREADLRAFVARCRNADGGYGVTPGAGSSTGGTYFASIILHWLDRK